MGENQVFPTKPVNPATTSSTPPTNPGVAQPVFRTGSAALPSAASLFPQFTTDPPMQPIVLNATQAAGTGTTFPAGWIKPPFPIPTTPGVQPIIINTTAAPAIPWDPNPNSPGTPTISGGGSGSPVTTAEDMPVGWWAFCDESGDASVAYSDGTLTSPVDGYAWPLNPACMNGNGIASVTLTATTPTVEEDTVLAQGWNLAVDPSDGNGQLVRADGVTDLAPYDGFALKLTITCTISGLPPISQTAIEIAPAVTTHNVADAPSNGRAAPPPPKSQPHRRRRKKK